MNLDPVVVRLRARLTGLKAVGAAADMDAMLAGLVLAPSCFVLPLAESGGESLGLSAPVQPLVQRFGVVHVLRNRRDASGAAALMDLAAARAALKAALVGWVMDAATGEPVTFAAGKLLRLDGDGLLLWMDEFDLTTFYWSA